MTPLPVPCQIALAAVVLLAAVLDVRSRNIPNWLTLGGIALGFVLNPWSSGWDGLKFAALGFGAAALIFLPLFFLRWLGGGDVKLMAAVGALAGAPNLLVIFILDALLGGGAAIVLIVARGRFIRTLRNIGLMLATLARGKAPHKESAELEAGNEKSLGLPRAVTIAAATLLLLWASR